MAKESELSAAEIIPAFNRLFTHYQCVMEPQLKKPKGRMPVGYYITSEGIKLVTGRVPETGEDSLPLDLPDYRWLNEWGKYQQREGVPTNHMLDWLWKDGGYKTLDLSPEQKSIFFKDLRVVERASQPYSKLHSSTSDLVMPWKVRAEQEAFFVYSNPERRRAYTVPSQNAFYDWLIAQSEISRRMELVIPQ